MALFAFTASIQEVFADGVTPFVTYDWPTNEGEAVASDNYVVRIRCGDTVETLEVLMSSGWTEEGGGPDVFRGRTFSWATFSSSFEAPITVEVDKLFGSGTQDIEVFPSGYSIDATPSPDGKSVSFDLSQSRYVSVNFKTADNEHTAGGIVRHMLMIFADPPEQNVPSVSSPGTHLFSSATTATDIANASLVYFPPGFHDLNGQLPNGFLDLRPGLEVYLEGGAFVVGKMISQGNADGCTIRGRGALSGRTWSWTPGGGESLIHASGANITVEGIHCFDTDFHGVVPGSPATMRNVKMWGWHYNNDGFRPWGGTVDHCFIRPADDALYVGGGKLVVTDTVIWQSFNGAVVTCGWGIEGNPYDTTDFTMTDCHILYPEWNGIGNNNGILASQLPYAASSSDIHFENIRIDGNVCAITNLKRNEAQGKTGTPGGISNVTFKNIVITGSQLVYNHNRTTVNASKSRIEGEDGFTINDVHFDNVIIGGTFVTEQNKDTYFSIDPSTTSNISFTHGTDFEAVGVSEIDADSAKLTVDLSGLSEHVVDLQVFWGDRDYGESSSSWPISSDPAHPELAGAEGGRRHEYSVTNLPRYRDTVFRWLLTDALGSTSWTAPRAFRPFAPNGAVGPGGIPGCLLWLDPNSVVKVNRSGNWYVETWFDQMSGAAAMSPGESSQPLYLANGIGGRPALYFDGDDAIVVGDLRETEGGGVSYVLSQCTSNPSLEGWPRLLTAAPDGGVAWTLPGWQMVAPGSTASGGTTFNAVVSKKTLTDSTIENTTIGSRPDLVQSFRGEVGAVIIFNEILGVSQEDALNWYFDNEFGLGADGDNDGLIDSWEKIHFGGTSVTMGLLDFDNDLVDNTTEQIWGYDPKNTAGGSNDGIPEILRTSEGVILRWKAASGRSYDVISSEHPENPLPWTLVPGFGHLKGFDGWIEVPVVPSEIESSEFFQILVHWP